MTLPKPLTHSDRIHLRQGLGSHRTGDVVFNLLNDLQTAPKYAGFKAATELTIATGAVVPTQAVHTVDTAADAAADVLTNMTGALAVAESVVIIRPASAARTITLSHGIGANFIATPGGINIHLAEATDWAMLVHNGTQWSVAYFSVLNTSTELTIASGAAAATLPAHTIDTEADAATDQLDTVTGGVAGQTMTLSTANAARDVTIAHSVVADGFACPGGEDIVLGATTDSIFCVHDGTQWQVVGVSALEILGGVRKVTVEILAAAVATLFGTPVSVIAAPGATKYIDVINCHWMLDHQGVDYDAAASGDTLVLQMGTGGTTVCDPVAGDAIGAASADYHTVVQAVPELIPVINTAIFAAITTGEWFGAAGDGILRAEIFYRVRTFDLS